MTIIENDYWVIDQTSEAFSGFIGYLCIWTLASINIATLLIMKVPLPTNITI